MPHLIANFPGDWPLPDGRTFLRLGFAPMRFLVNFAGLATNGGTIHICALHPGFAPTIEHALTIRHGSSFLGGSCWYFAATTIVDVPVLM
jgi:hypothetical protein